MVLTSRLFVLFVHLASLPVHSYRITQQIKDAVALCEFFAWMEDQLNKGQQVSELSAVDKLEELRKYVEEGNCSLAACDLSLS